MTTGVCLKCGYTSWDISNHVCIGDVKFVRSTVDEPVKPQPDLLDIIRDIVREEVERALKVRDERT